MSEHRDNPRYDLASMDVTFGDQPCDLINVSSTGVLLGGVEGGPSVGDNCEFTLWVPAMGMRSPLVIEGKAVRTDDGGLLAIDYATPANTWPRLLKILDSRERGA